MGLSRSIGGFEFLQLDLECLGAVVFDGFLKPWVLQCFFSGDALFGIIDKYSSQQVHELFVE